MARPLSSWLVCVTLLGGSLPLGALAQKGSAVYEEALGKAKSAFENGAFGEAAELFKDAFNVEPRGNLLYNIALSYEKAGDVANAVGYYQRFIDAVPGTPKRTAIERHMADLKTQLQDQYAEVSVTTEPAGAVVFVDDKSRGAMGAAPVTFKLLPGTYTIIAEKQGHEPARKKVDVVQGRPTSVSLSLYSSSAVGTINLLVSERDADVHIDGKRVARSPLEDPLKLPGGRHEIMVMKTGFATWKQEVEVKAGATQQLQVSLAVEGGDGEEGGGEVAGGGGEESSSGGLFSGDRLVPAIVAGAGLLLVGGGVYTGLQANTLHDQLDERRKAGKPIAAADVDTGNTYVLMTNVLLGVGGAALVGGGIWWFLSDGAPETSSRIDVGMAPDGSPSVLFQGTF